MGDRQTCHFYPPRCPYAAEETPRWYPWQDLAQKEPQGLAVRKQLSVRRLRALLDAQNITLHQWRVRMLMIDPSDAKLSERILQYYLDERYNHRRVPFHRVATIAASLGVDIESVVEDVDARTPDQALAEILARADLTRENLEDMKLSFLRMARMSRGRKTAVL